MDNATINSLAIIDELGRGTCTNDGIIIAKTILEVLRKNLGCLCLFTTHYHDLISWCKEKDGIDLYFMNCIVDEFTKDIKFLYKFNKGFCPESYGISVAKLAGIPVIKFYMNYLLFFYYFFIFIFILIYFLA